MQKKIFVIAEAGVNHNGSIERAEELVRVAKAAGADAVKFQTFKADRLVSKSAPKAAYQVVQTGSAESQHEMIRKLELSDEDHQRLQELCKSIGIQFLSTPFDTGSLDFLVGKMGLPLIKLASGEVGNAPLLLHAGRAGKPIILSTGMSDIDEVERALGALAFGFLKRENPSAAKFQAAWESAEGKRVVQEKVTLLQCTTEYPAPFAEVNLRAMHSMAEAFGVRVGLSDHTPGISVAVAAVGAGAEVIEKHFTLDKSLPGPDHQASLDPQELRDLMRMVREAEMALGNGRKVPAASEIKNRAVVRCSLVARRAIAAGEKYTAENLTVKRPGTGISSYQYWEYLGRAANRAYREDELIHD